MIFVDVYMSYIVTAFLCRIREIDQILKASDDVKKNSKLHEILKSLKEELEVGFQLPW